MRASDGWTVANAVRPSFAPGAGDRAHSASGAPRFLMSTGDPRRFSIGRSRIHLRLQRFRCRLGQGQHDPLSIPPNAR